MSAGSMKAMGWMAMYALAFAWAPLKPAQLDPHAAIVVHAQPQAQP